MPSGSDLWCHVSISGLLISKQEGKALVTLATWYAVKKPGYEKGIQETDQILTVNSKTFRHFRLFCEISLVIHVDGSPKSYNLKILYIGYWPLSICYPEISSKAQHISIAIFEA